MNDRKWNKLRWSESRSRAWELFHENSKTSLFEEMPPNEVILSKMARYWESLPFQQYPSIALPSPAPAPSMPLGQAIEQRRSARKLIPRALSLAEVATLLQYTYGVTRDNTGSIFPRPFRAVPSGGALFPLELFLLVRHVTGLQPGTYHYNPTRSALRLLDAGDAAPALSKALVQPELASDASLVVCISAVFERTTFKYGDRGYRFVLLEAGHVGQNLDLVATALQLACVNVGGFFDRRVDQLLQLDGLTHSTLYLAAIGGTADGSHE